MLAGMLTPRSHFEGLSFANKIYAAGVDRFASLGNKSVQSIEVYDVESNNWQIVATGLTLSKNISVCEAHLQSVIKTDISCARTECRVQRDYFMVTSEQVVKNLGGVTLLFGDETFIRHSLVMMFVDNHPDNIPSTYKPVTACFTCFTKEEFQKPAELELLSNLTDSSDKLVTILQKLSFGDKWKAVGLTKPMANKVKLQINAPCQLIGVVLNSEQSPIGSLDNINEAPLPLRTKGFSAEHRKRQANTSEVKVRKVSQTPPSHPTEVDEPNCGTSLSSNKKTTLNESRAGVEEIKRENLEKKSWSEEHDAFTSEFEECMKKTAESSKTIGSNGGEIHLCGCALEFPDGALIENKELSVSVDNNPSNFPPNLEPISVILGFKPSMQFDNPVTVSVKTWFRALEGQTVPVVLSSKRSGFDWKKVDEITIGDTNEEKFTVRHFCDISLGVAPEEAKNGLLVLYNDIYIQRESGRISSCFHLDSKSEREMWDIMRRRSNTVFSTIPSLPICGKQDQTVTVKANITEPPNMNLSIEYPSTAEFTIGDIPGQRQLCIQFKPHPRFGDYDGFVEGKHIAKVDGKEKARIPLERKWSVR